MSVAVHVFSLKRHIWLRDAGQCCICGRWLTSVTVNSITELHFSSVVVMEETNLWTLCTECHRQKSAREAAGGMPDPTLPEVSGGSGRADDIIGL